jgi:hypothetical protein
MSGAFADGDLAVDAEAASVKVQIEMDLGC